MRSTANHDKGKWGQKIKRGNGKVREQEKGLTGDNEEKAGNY